MEYLEILGICFLLYLLCVAVVHAQRGLEFLFDLIEEWIHKMKKRGE